MENKRIRFLHVLPLKCIGGVECAALTTENISNRNFLFSLYFVTNKSKKNHYKFVDLIYFLPDAFISIFKILNYSPDVLIISLWKSCLVAFFVKLFRPKVKIILFLHNSNLNFIDYLLNNLIGILAFEIWADSLITLKNRMKSFHFISSRSNKKIISFILDKIKPLPINVIKTNFIFWGRLHPIKNIKTSIDIFYSVYKKRKDSKFIIIGPDDGDYQNLNEYIKKLGLVNNVKMYDQMSFDEIRGYAKNSSFFIQSSLSEGMAMSVSESMQLGLVPVVTNVGNIKNYCIADFNSILIDKLTIRKILEISENEKKYLDLRKNAIETWQSKISYKQDVYENCLRLADKIKK